MERKSKNIIMLLLCIIFIGGILFTGWYAKDHLKNTNQSMGMGQPPSMPGNSTNETNSNELQAKSEESSNELNNTTKSEISSNEPPELPEGETSNSSSKEPVKVSNEYNELIPPDMQNNTSTKVKLTTNYYIIYASLSLAISLIILYLIMSGFNNKTFKETFKNADKLAIYILLVIITTTGLTIGEGYVTNNYVLKNTTSSNNSNMQGGNTSTNVSYSSKKEITSDENVDSGEYESTSSDENTISVSKATSTLSNITVTKTGDSDGGDNTSFYGTNSAIIAKDGANLTIKNATITTNATGANGVFSYGGSATTNNSNSDGTTINISDSKITTTKDNSGGIMTTGGGTMNASNLTINTAGTSSAAIRSDRGGGTVNVDGGTYKTTGQGSPAIYSTANITVKNATLISTASEGAIIEGKNSITLENVKLTDTNNKLNGQSTTYKNIFIYQSMSGDAATGEAKFSAKNSTITTNKGDSIYVTNTSTTITLENNEFTNNDKEGNFLRVQKDSWGNSGSNGGEVTMNFKNQKATGNIVVDSISTLTFNLTNNSYYEGTINGDNSAKSITLKLDKNSKIKLTGNSYVTSLEDADTSYSNIDFNGYKLYVNNKAIN